MATPTAISTPAATPDPLLTTAQVCALLTISRTTLWRLAADDPTLQQARVQLTTTRHAWRAPVIAQWQASRMEAA